MLREPEDENALDGNLNLKDFVVGIPKFGDTERDNAVWVCGGSNTRCVCIVDTNKARLLQTISQATRLSNPHCNRNISSRKNRLEKTMSQNLTELAGLREQILGK